MPKPLRNKLVLCVVLLLSGQCVLASRTTPYARKLSQVDQGFIDPTTPAAAKTISRCSEPTPVGSATSPCDSLTPPTTTMQLVFSDEFNTPRDLSVKANDSKWTADDVWCAGTHDMEVYTPSQAQISNGFLNLVLENATEVLTVPTPADYITESWATEKYGPDGKPPPLYGYWNHKTNWDPNKFIPTLQANDTPYKSGMVTSWNKFCFTGGYIEAAIQMPGTVSQPGYWPGFWLLGNLARACRGWSTRGIWPYTYNSCGGEWWKTIKGAPEPQLITSCPDAAGIDRTKWGFAPGQGRGAPEIDMVEYKVEWDNDVKRFFPQSVITLQSSPPLPNGTTWTNIGKGQIFPTVSKQDLQTGKTKWVGDYTNVDQSSDPTLRPGNLYQDSISGFVRYSESEFDTPYRIGVHWEPGEFLRWYVNDKFVYEVNKDALIERTNSQGEKTGPRLIPEEAMYIILNLAISDGFTHNFIYSDTSSAAYKSFLYAIASAFPGVMKVDYVRVYQDPNKINIGCSPPKYPTEQYIACNPEKFSVTAEDKEALIPARCLGDWSTALDFNFDYVGATLANLTNVTDVKQCSNACIAYPGCGSFSYSQSYEACFLKNITGWTKTYSLDMLSGNITAPVCQLLKGVSYEGGDLAGGAVNTTSAIECCRLCSQTKGCSRFTYTPGSSSNCALKETSGSKKVNATVEGTVSGNHPGPTSTMSLCNLKPDVLLDGAPLLDSAGSWIQATARNAVDCCKICKDVTGCFGFSYVPANNATGVNCFLHENKESLLRETNATVEGTVSGYMDAEYKAATAVCTATQLIKLDGGDLKTSTGDYITEESANYTTCCTICRAIAGCGAWTFENRVCSFKNATGWRAVNISTKSDTTGQVVPNTYSGRMDGVALVELPANETKTGKTVCKEEENLQYQGGDITVPAADGRGANLMTATAPNHEICCTICGNITGCAGYSWDPVTTQCYLKQREKMGWSKIDKQGWVSGVIMSSDAVRASFVYASLLMAIINFMFQG